MLSLGQLSEQEIDIKTKNSKIYLYQKEKIIITKSEIEQIWLINSTHWLVRVLSTQEVVVQALKKDKNNILYICLRHIGKTHRKKLFQ